ncbi:MAG: hypothetical protein ABI067_17875 [Leifsonia sp.]
MTGPRFAPGAEWAPTPRDRTPQTVEHRCGLCYGPFGKSAIRCKNEPDPLGRLLADLPDYPTKEND